MKKRFRNILRKNGKKNGMFILICAVILTISFGTLVGCSTTQEDTEKEIIKNEEIQNVSDQIITQTQQIPDESSADENTTLGNTTMLTFSKEGEQEQKQATLAVGDGYSIYLPDNEWKQSDSDTWTTTVNENVRIWIRHFEDEPLDSVTQKLVEDGYTTQEGDHKWKQEGDLTYHARLKTLENDVWGIFYSYPTDFEEGWGVSCL